MALFITIITITVSDTDIMVLEVITDFIITTMDTMEQVLEQEQEEEHMPQHMTLYLQDPFHLESTMAHIFLQEIKHQL